MRLPLPSGWSMRSRWPTGSAIWRTTARVSRSFTGCSRPGGRVAILEFSQPTVPLLGPLFDSVLPLRAAADRQRGLGRRRRYSYLKSRSRNSTRVKSWPRRCARWISRRLVPASDGRNFLPARRLETLIRFAHANRGPVARSPYGPGGRPSLKGDESRRCRDVLQTLGARLRAPPALHRQRRNLGLRVADRPARQGRALPGARLRGPRDQEADGEGRDLLARVDDEARGELGGDDAARRGTFPARRPDLEVVARVRPHAGGRARTSRTSAAGQATGLCLRSAPITVRHLLSHSAGLASGTPA